MKAIAARVLGCWGTFAVCALLFPGSCNLLGIFLGGTVLAVLYLFVRPLLQAVILPLNLFLFGILTPLTDAWLVLWACAWTPGTGLGYWQSVCAALIASLFWLPYAQWKRKISLLS